MAAYLSPATMTVLWQVLSIWRITRFPASCATGHRQNNDPPALTAMGGQRPYGARDFAGIASGLALLSGREDRAHLFDGDTKMTPALVVLGSP